MTSVILPLPELFALIAVCVTVSLSLSGITFTKHSPLKKNTANVGLQASEVISLSVVAKQLKHLPANVKIGRIRCYFVRSFSSVQLLAEHCQSLS